MKKQGGASEPSPGGRFPRSSLAEGGDRRPFFRRHVVVLLCGWDVAAPRGRLRPSGARESPLFWGGCFNQDIFKDPKRHDHLSVLYNKDNKNKRTRYTKYSETTLQSAIGLRRRFRWHRLPGFCKAWSGLEVGNRLFLAPHPVGWPTDSGRLSVNKTVWLSHETRAAGYHGI